MNATLRKIQALAAKDFVDLFKNPGVAASLIIPIGLVFMQSLLVGDATADVRAGSDEAASFVISTLLQAGLCMTISMLGSMAVLYSLAEEKEKHTLRTLILSNVSAGQILVSKAAVGLVAIVAVAAACFAVICYEIPGVDVALLPAYLLLTLVGALTIVIPSLVLGLACRDQMTASFYSVPTVLLALVPLSGAYNETAARVALLAPTGGAARLMDMVATGTFSWGDAAAPLAVTAAWIVVGIVLFKVLYKRLARDN